MTDDDTSTPNKSHTRTGDQPLDHVARAPRHRATTSSPNVGALFI
ncbi:hypothetical protein [Nocardia asiatica]|nr:hypothetical protein [Nocardia asiatica]